MAKNTNGVVIYRGPSMLDGAPIIVVATGLKKGSANSKTGDEVQTWIIREDVHPSEALKTGDDESICGNCGHRPINGGTCYVLVFQAPRSVWEAYHKGSYAEAEDFEMFRGRTVRFGSYGDPAAVPVSVWQGILEVCDGHTGYTHQWRNEVGQALKGICQASCDSLIDYVDASLAGWKTFLVKPANVADPEGSVHCAASEEKGKKTNCATCQLCDGASANVVINAHGRSGKKVQWA